MVHAGWYWQGVLICVYKWEICGMINNHNCSWGDMSLGDGRRSAMESGIEEWVVER